MLIKRLTENDTKIHFYVRDVIIFIRARIAILDIAINTKVISMPKIAQVVDFYSVGSYWLVKIVTAWLFL